MILLKIVNKRFYFILLLVIFVSYELIMFDLISICHIMKNKIFILSFVSIYFLSKIERLISVEYLKLIFFINIKSIVFKLIGLVFYTILIISFIFLQDTLLFVKEVVILTTLFIVSIFLYKFQIKSFERTLILIFTYSFITYAIW